MSQPDKPYHVLVADDEESMRFVLREVLSDENCIVDEAEDGQQAVEKARETGYDLYLLDVRMPNLDGLSALKEIRKLYPQALVVMITAFGTTQIAREALEAGAFDYFTKPFNIDELRIVLLRALEKQTLVRRIHQLEERLSAPRSMLANMVGQSEQMQRVSEMVGRVAEHDVTVLIHGESGTGKELVAQAIHDGSARRDAPFIKVNCAAIPEPLLESELFGHERGAFTGATHTRAGKFEAANGGTILLDEIGEMPLALQAKLLRILQEHEVERVGADRPRSVDIRVLAATNRNLQEMVAEKTFREDLYFRLNVMPIDLPPLRERGGDLVLLVNFFLGEFNARMGKLIRGFSPEAMELLERYPWPGNVRELENTIQRSMIMTNGDFIDVHALPPALRENSPVTNPASPPDSHISTERTTSKEVDLSVPLAAQIERLVEAEEQRIIAAALEHHDGHRQKSADLLGISRKSLHNKMVKYGLLSSSDEE